MSAVPERDVQPVPSGDGSPKFGRLLIVLVLAVMLIGAITLGAEAYYS
jgi:4-hydroxybenzoate polyprenyltransferase